MVRKNQIPSGWSIEAADFINKLILRAPGARLGAKSGIKELKAHPWLLTVNWSDLASKRIKSPFRQKDHPYELTQREEDISEALMQYKLLQRVETKMDAFARYFFQYHEK